MYSAAILCTAKDVKKGKGYWQGHLEVLVKGKVAAIDITLALRGPVDGLLCTRHDTGLLVVGDTLLEEVGLASKGDVLHEVEGVADLVHLLVTERQEQAVGNELDVLLHQVGVHAEESTGKRLRQELLLDDDSVSDDVLDDLLARAVVEVGEQEASEVGVETLVTRDQLVGEGQAGHEAALLEPEDGGECTAEEDTLDGSEGNEALGKSRLLVIDPSKGPVGLLADARN